MSKLDISNPDVIKFLKETYERTDYLRMKWNFRNKEKLQLTAILHREEKGYYETDVLKSAMVAGMQTLTKDHAIGALNLRKTPIRDGVHITSLEDLKKGHSLVDVGLGDTKEDPRLGRPDIDLTFDPIMRPVVPKQKKIIYKGIPNFGRMAYLKTRNKIDPEDKYYFNQSVGWTYGWRLKDSFFGTNKPKYGRVWCITRDSRSRSGPQPDPDHYKEVEVEGTKKCR